MKLVGNGSFTLPYEKHIALAYQGNITYVVGKEVLIDVST